MSRIKINPEISLCSFGSVEILKSKKCHRLIGGGILFLSKEDTKSVFKNINRHGTMYDIITVLKYLVRLGLDSNI